MKLYQALKKFDSYKQQVQHDHQILNGHKTHFYKIL